MMGDAKRDVYADMRVHLSESSATTNSGRRLKLSVKSND